MSSRRERQALAQRKYRAAHLEEDRARSRAYRTAHREAVRVYNANAAVWCRKRQRRLKGRREEIREQLATLAKEEQECRTYLESVTRKKSSGPVESSSPSEGHNADWRIGLQTSTGNSTHSSRKSKPSRSA